MCYYWLLESPLCTLMYVVGGCPVICLNDFVDKQTLLENAAFPIKSHGSAQLYHAQTTNICLDPLIMHFNHEKVMELPDKIVFIQVELLMNRSFGVTQLKKYI